MNYIQNYFLLFLLNLIHNLAASIATKAAERVAIQTGKIIAVGLFEFSDILMAITVVGMSCKDAVLTKTSIAIELLNTFLFGLFSWRDSIAFNPRGVDALPSPRIFAIIFKEISSCALSFSFTSGNKNLTSGFKNFASFFDNPESFAICIMPHQSVIVPKKVIVNSTAEEADSNMPLFIFSRLPLIRLYEYEVIIKIGHKMFNM